MSLFTSLLAASASELPFSVAWKRLRCMSNKHRAHDYENGKRIDKLTSQNHPQNCKDYVFTVNINECSNCGMIFVDSGFESKK